MTSDEADGTELVRASYDAIFERYAAWDDDAVDDVRQRAFEHALALVPSRRRALDLGCGTGTKITHRIASEFEHLTAVDVSPRSIAAARATLPDAELLVADMTTLELGASSLDLVTAFFSIIHVPAAEQPALFRRIATWLAPGGILVCNLGTAPGDQHDDFLGAPMFWSSLAPTESIAALADAGLDVLHHEVDTRTEHGVAVSFLWITARRVQREVA
ncbi:MAG TPA: class I SAM-dependent methyltransferase [Acidimicrobiia bacterium]|nr:class I SAM-dependent methyltransferase [Acidimicrobiia bacterium]